MEECEQVVAECAGKDVGLINPKRLPALFATCRSAEGIVPSL